MGMFKGFQKTGGFETTVKPTNMFAGFCDTAFGEVGNVGGVPSTGLVAWFRPDVNITVGSGKVSQWQDTTGTYTLSAAGTAQPSYIVGDQARNGRPYLSFNGTSNVLSGSSVSIGTNTQWHVIMIYKWNGTGTYVLYDSDPTASPGRVAFYQVSSSTYGVYRSSIGTAQLIRTSDTNMNMIGMQVDRVNGLIYQDYNYQYRAQSGTTVVESTNFVSAGATFGASGTIDYSNAYLFDIFVYNQLLSQTDYLMLRGYMGNLYNF